MGWSKDLIADKPIKEEDVESIVNALPDDVYGPFGTLNKQAWGWSAIVDISKPVKRILTISGAFYSQDYAGLVARTLKKELMKRGYAIKIGRISI